MRHVAKKIRRTGLLQQELEITVEESRPLLNWLRKCVGQPTLSASCTFRTYQTEWRHYPSGVAAPPWLCDRLNILAREFRCRENWETEDKQCSS